MKTQEITTKSIKLETSEIERINTIASYKNRSVHFIMKEAIKEYILHQEKRMYFILEAEQALQHFKDTGLHITLDELDEWINNPNQEMIECHK
jgi:predicted transcriptional regulator